jgi:uncharacterized protein involved in exopolysaccharide biosynthesis
MLALPATARATRLIPTPKTVLVPLFKDLPKLILVFLLVLGAAGTVAWFMKPQHVAQALLYAKYGREYAYRTQSGDAELVAQTLDPKEVVKSESRILGAPDLAGEVVARLGVQTLYPELLARPASRPLPFLDLPTRRISPEAAARTRFQDSFSAEAGEDGHVIEVSFQHPDPEIAVRALDELLDAYLNHRRLLFADRRAEALRPQVEAAQVRLAQAETALATYRSGNGIIAFDAQRTQLLNRKAELGTELETAERERASIAERVSQLRQSLDTTPATLVLHADTGDNEALAKGREELLQLRLEERKLLTDYGPAHPQVRDIRARVAQAEQFVDEQSRRPTQSTRRGRNPVYDALVTQLAQTRADLAGAESQCGLLKRQLADTEQELTLLDTKDVVVSRLTREHELAEANYRLVAQKLDEAKMLDETAMRDAANVRVLQSALLLDQPHDLRPLVLGLGFIAACVATLLAAFLSDLLRAGFLTPEQLERETGLPVLAAFPVRTIRPWGTEAGLGDGGTFTGRWRP